MLWLLRERWTLHAPLNAADAIAKLASLTGPVESGIWHAGSPFAGEVAGLGFRLFRRRGNGRPSKSLQMLGRVSDEAAGCSADVEFCFGGTRQRIGLIFSLCLLLAAAIAAGPPLRYVLSFLAGAQYVASVVSFTLATRRTKRLLAAALGGLDADALEAAAAGPGWARDIIIAVVALAALLLGVLVRR